MNIDDQLTPLPEYENSLSWLPLGFAKIQYKTIEGLQSETFDTSNMKYKSVSKIREIPARMISRITVDERND